MLKFVVGLFESKGIAEDAINRLRYEGVPDGNIFPMLIHETAPLPAAVSPAVEALSLDPLVVGNVRDTFAPFIRNGETAVFVRAESEGDSLWRSAFRNECGKRNGWPRKASRSIRASRSREKPG
jgi:hypothetical protein